MTPHERVASIGKDPYAMVTDMKISEFLAIKEHVKICDECNAILDAIEALPLPKKKYGESSQN